MSMNNNKKIPAVIKKKILKMLLNKAGIQYQKKLDSESLGELEDQLKQMNDGS